MKKSTQIALALSSFVLIGGSCQVTPTNESVSNNTNTEINSAPEFLTYTNDTHNFSFQYPSTWTVEESEADIEGKGLTQILGISGPDYRYISFSITQVSEFSELKTLIEQSDVLADGTSLAQISQEEEVLIDGRRVIKAQQATALGIPEDIYYVELENGNFLFISAHQLDDNLVEEEIINSLRFTGDWLTYTSEDLGFSFQYPPEYQLTASSGGLYLDQSNGEGIKFYLQPYDLALDYDTMLYSKSSLLKLKNGIANEENVEVYNSIPVPVGFNFDVPGAAFYRGASFFIGNDYVDVSMVIDPQNIEYPNRKFDEEVRMWSVEVIDQLDQGNLLSTEDKERVRIFDQIISTIKEERNTYTNQKYGFSFNYPKSWNVDDTETDFIKVNSAGTQLEIEAKQTIPSDVQFNIFSDRTKAPYLSGGDFQNGLQEAQTRGQISDLSFANTFTAQFTEYNDFLDQEQKQFYFLLPSGNLVTGPYVSSHLEAELIEHIFESFDGGEDTGTSVEDVSEWLTYSDNRYNFTIRYPKSWVYTNPVLVDGQGLGYFDPIGFNENFHLATLQMNLVSYQQMLDREPTEWVVISRETQILNGIEITHEVGEAPRSLGTDNFETYTYNSYVIPFDESKTLMVFLSGDEEEYVGVVEEMLESLNF